MKPERFVDGGHYELPNDNTIVLYGPPNGVRAHFRFSEVVTTT